MQVVSFFLAQAVFILWLAAPVILVVAVGALGIAAIGMLTSAVVRQNFNAAIGGLLMVAFTVATGWAGYLFFKGTPGRIPRVDVAERRVEWRRPLPAVFVSGGHWDDGPSMALIR